MKRIVLYLLSVFALVFAGVPTAAAAAGDGDPPFAERYRAVQHGGFARAANAVITCGTTASEGAPDCARAQDGETARSGQYVMAYIDTDSDANTYNSSSAELRIPAGARVTYARLYWSANLRVGELKPSADNGRVLIAEPGGRYKELLADSPVQEHDTGAALVFSASADVTDLVRSSRSGSWTVGQINTAGGHSPEGGWGGWTLVAAYEHPDEPLRELVLWDGLGAVGQGRELSLAADGLDIPAGADGRLGLVAGGGDRGVDGDQVTVRVPGGPTVALGDAANPTGDVLNGTVSDLGDPRTARTPAYVHTLGYDADVLDLSHALRDGADGLGIGFGGGRDGYHVGAVFLQAAVRP
ncbi:hypothetical protein [Streptomyces avicenniae]|uniref:hypothetical protein n=1 Tax=Streptomyces avicenniae TaxID=500153 RepID=UPI00069C3F29|nr:hypothetical protein [Streptomyces avicenniae]